MPALRLAIVAVLLVPLVAIVRDPIAINHDAALCLVTADQMLSGRMLYVDVVDMSPPLIFYLSIVPAAFARVLGTPIVLTFQLTVWLLTVASTVVTYAACRRAFEGDRVRAALVALSVAASSMLVMYFGHWGQREHLFVLAFLPYVAIRAGRAARHSFSVVPAACIGAVAAFGASIKPHFVAISLIADAFLITATRSPRLLRAPEFIAFVATGSAYALHFLILPGAMRDAWFGRWIPFIASGYRAYDTPIRWLTRSALTFWVPPFVLGMFVFVRRNRTAHTLFARAMAIAALAGLASYAVQRKGWGYHAIPVGAAVAPMLALLTCDLVERIWRRVSGPQRRGIQMIAMATFLVVVTIEIAAGGFGARSPRQRLEEVARSDELPRAIATYSKPGEPVCVMATTVRIAFPVLAQFGRPPGCRFMFSPLPMLYVDVTAESGQPFPYQLPPGQLRDAEVRYRREMQQDIQSRRPSIILVGTPQVCQACPFGFNLDDYLVRSGFLHDAMSNYRLASVGPSANVYVRRATPASDSPAEMPSDLSERPDAR